MRCKNCHFEFKQVDIDEVEKLLCTISRDNCAGKDCLDGKLLRTVAIYMSTPIWHLFNARLTRGNCTKLWKNNHHNTNFKNSKSSLNGPTNHNPNYCQ